MLLGVCVCVTQVLSEVNLLRAATVRLFAVGVDSLTVWRAVRDLSIPPQIRGINYYLSASPSDLTTMSGSVATSVSLFCYPRRLCRSAWVGRSRPSVCLSVRLFVRSIT